MKFLAISTLAALAGLAAAQGPITEIGLTCNNLYGSQNTNKLDPKGWYVIEKDICGAIGGTLYADDVICCPKDDASTTFGAYNQACSRRWGTSHWGFEAVKDFRCPKLN